MLNLLNLLKQNCSLRWTEGLHWGSLLLCFGRVSGEFFGESGERKGSRKGVSGYEQQSWLLSLEVYPQSGVIRDCDFSCLCEIFYCVNVNGTLGIFDDFEKLFDKGLCCESDWWILWICINM